MTRNGNGGVMLQAWTWDTPADGTFWKTAAGQAQAWRELGIGQVWLPPACKALGGPEDSGYAIYDLYDLGSFDQKGGVRTKYGTESEFIACVQALADAGLTPLADIVLNHRMGADETERFLVQRVDQADRTRTEGEPFEIEGWTRYTFPGRGTERSDFQWRWYHFTAVDAAADHELDDDALYRIAEQNFAEDVGETFGNADFLMGCDVALSKPDVAEHLMGWGRWFLETSKVHGFRIDAAKHMSAGFQKRFVEAMRDAAQAPLPSVCEFATPDVEEILAFVEETGGALDCFDFPLKYRLLKAAKEGAGYDLRTLADATLVQRCPAQAVTFVDNHDSEPAQHPDAPEWVDDWFKPLAYAFILLREAGTPCVFAQDLQREATGDTVRRLMQLRRDFAHGEQTDCFAEPQRIAWVRAGTAEHPGAMVVLLNVADAAALRVDTGRPETEFVNAFDPSLRLTTGADGAADFDIPAGGLAVWTTS